MRRNGDRVDDDGTTRCTETCTTAAQNGQAVSQLPTIGKPSSHAGQRAIMTLRSSMTAKAQLEKRGGPKAAVFLVAAIAAITTIGVSAPVGAEPWGQSLELSALLRPTLFDSDYPGHPRATARGQSGTIGTLQLGWVYSREVRVDVGVLARLPFAIDFEREAGAFPLLSVTITPFDDALTLRFGSLDIEHGFHPAVVDEARYNYGRNYEELYNQSIPMAAWRDFGGDPFLPVENGAQLIADIEPLHAELFLDWQLLETIDHREKFTVGVLGSYDGRWLSAGFQYRLVHYGGQLFTQREPIRQMGLDPKRQPTTLLLSVTAKPLAWLEHVALELPVAFVQGRVVQSPGESEGAHRGLELGVDTRFFDTLTLGYRLWLPDDGQARYVSEDGDPIYAGPRSHRVRIAVKSVYGIAELAGLLDLVFARGNDKVQYRTVTTLTLRWDAVLWADTPLP